MRQRNPAAIGKNWQHRQRTLGRLTQLLKLVVQQRYGDFLFWSAAVVDRQNGMVLRRMQLAPHSHGKVLPVRRTPHKSQRPCQLHCRDLANSLASTTTDPRERIAIVHQDLPRCHLPQILIRIADSPIQALLRLTGTQIKRSHRAPYARRSPARHRCSAESRYADRR